MQGGGRPALGRLLTEGLVEAVAPLGQTGRGLSSLVGLPVSGLSLLWVGIGWALLPTLSPGTWSGAWGLGSSGVSLALSGSHQMGTWSDLPCLRHSGRWSQVCPWRRDH